MIEIKDETQFNEVTGSKEYTLVKFGSKTCGKCMLLEKQMEGAVNDLKDICQLAVIDSHQVPDVFTKLQINHIPVMCVFKEGKLLSSYPRVATSVGIVDFVKKSIKDNEEK